MCLHNNWQSWSNFSKIHCLIIRCVPALNFNCFKIRLSGRHSGDRNFNMADQWFFNFQTCNMDNSFYNNSFKIRVWRTASDKKVSWIPAIQNPNKKIHSFYFLIKSQSCILFQHVFALRSCGLRNMFWIKSDSRS